ncbi:MAG: MFS transporter [Oscillochloris sp.]|nr:MFS transporter [Oscillochloris sp.]
MNDANLSAATRRITATLFASQSLASAAIIAAFTVSAIIIVDLSGTEASAGLPSTLTLAGAAFAAYPAGRMMQRFGRRIGLSLGFLFGLVGMGLGAVAVLLPSFVVFLFGLLFIGVARGFVDQSRYAAADAAPISERARAISLVVFAGTVGAIGGPLLVGPLGVLATQFGLPELIGPLLGGAILFGLGGLVILALLFPEPQKIAQALAAAETRTGTAAPEGTAHNIADVLRIPAGRTALVAMVIGQMVMVLIMSVTSLHMHQNGHELGNISLVIGAHTFGMFGFSMLTGWFADRLGRPATIAIGALILIVGAIVGPLSLQVFWLAVALFLVGLGWNLCYIAGSSLLADSLTAGERGRVQGASDLLVNLGAATGSLGSGVVLANFGYGALCLLGGLFALLPLLMAAGRMRADRTIPAVGD